ncbi:MAG: trigger factor [Prevotella sp.]|nr:trigger factor [Prevotella sp.]
MNITFEAPDKVNGLMTITLENADYQGEVDKTLKDYRKRANVPGFRPGQTPMSLIKRQYGTAVKVDTVNKMLGEKLYEYVRENKIQMLGEPLPSEQQEPIDFEGDKPLTFMFDIAVAPEFKAELTGRDKIDYYNITVDDKLIDQQVDMYQSRAGQYEKVEKYDAEQRDMLKGDLRELDEKGNAKEGGIEVADAVLMPQYMKVDDQKKLFDGCKLGDVITWNPRKAYPESDVEVSSLLKIEKDQVAEHTGDFTYQITEISRFVKAEVNQQLFDQTFGEGTVKDEKEFRQRISDMISQQFKADSDYKFLLDVRAHMENKVGKLEFPEALLKRVMKQNNKDRKDVDDFVDKNFDASIKELGWHLIKEQLVAAQNIKVEDDDLKAVAKEAARAQFAQYGMSNIPDEYLDNYAQEMLKKRENVDGLVDRAVDVKLTAALKQVVKLNEKDITLDAFEKMLNEK